MKKLFSFAIVCLFLAQAYSQKVVHDPNVQVRQVSGYHGIEVSGGIDLYLSSGDEAVAVSAKETSVRDRIKTEVKDGVLKIYYDWKDMKNWNFSGNKGLKAYVSYKTLDLLIASGGSEVKVDGSIQAGKLQIRLSGGSDFTGKVNVSTLDIDQSGGSDMDISGTAGLVDINASGGCDINGYDLIADNCKVHASGGSDITITVNKVLSAEASGASDIHWKGTATVEKSTASGSGSVSHRS
jgi:hypothetical protein